MIAQLCQSLFVMSVKNWQLQSSETSLGQTLCSNPHDAPSNSVNSMSNAAAVNSLYVRREKKIYIYIIFYVLDVLYVIYCIYIYIYIFGVYDLHLRPVQSTPQQLNTNVLNTGGLWNDNNFCEAWTWATSMISN